jgi:thioredoxin-dependent peroxiredoxin
MTKLVLGLVAAFVVAAVAGPGSAAEGDAPAPKVGDKAPDFKLMGTDGKEYTLKQFRKKSAVVIAWYPKALTGG